MKIDKTEFDKGILSIRDCVSKFKDALADINPQEHEKILQAGDYFYANLQQKLLPLHNMLKNNVLLCIEKREYDNIQVLIECLQEVDELIDEMENIKQR